jgi:hypothetical protein
MNPLTVFAKGTRFADVRFVRRVRRRSSTAGETPAATWWRAQGCGALTRICLKPIIQGPIGTVPPESQGDSGPKPKVAAKRLPWVHGQPTVPTATRLRPTSPVAGKGERPQPRCG